MYLEKQTLDFFSKSKEKALDVVVVSVVQTQGSTYSKQGNILLINSNLESIGVLGGFSLHQKILELVKDALKTGLVKTYKSIPEDKTSGHGILHLQIEPFFHHQNYKNIENYLKNPFRVLIFGSDTHVSSMIDMANLMGWETTVIDIDLKKQNVNHAHHLIRLENLDDILNMNLDIYQASVILSHNRKTDDTYLKALLQTKMNYIGMMGNKNYLQRKKQEFNLEDEKRFFAPIGFDIGSHTHQSIALSICAQIEARKNNKI